MVKGTCDAETMMLMSTAPYVLLRSSVGGICAVVGADIVMF